MTRSDVAQVRGAAGRVRPLCRHLFVSFSPSCPKPASRQYTRPRPGSTAFPGDRWRLSVRGRVELQVEFVDDPVSGVVSRS